MAVSSLSKNWNPYENYWELHPMILSIKVFRDFYNKDKSKNKENSSRIMWAIAMLVDPNENNPWRNLYYKDKVSLIADDYIGDKKFNFDNYQDLVNEYELRCITASERELIELEKKIIERSNFIKNTPYTLDVMEEDDETGKMKLIKGTATQLDTLLLNTQKIYLSFETIKEKIAKETVSGEFGGLTMSAADKGDI